VHAPAIFAAASLTCAYGYIVNDYVDRNDDRRTHPQRALPQGLVSPPTALLLALSLAVVALAVSATVSIGIAFIDLLALGLLASYTPMKRINGFIANIIAGSIYGLLVVFGMTAGQFRLPVAGVALATTLVLVGREIVLDVRDAESDQLAGIRSIPVVRGVPAAFRWATWFFLLGSAALMVSGLQFAEPFRALVLCTLVIILLWTGLIRYRSTLAPAEMERFRFLTQMAFFCVIAILVFVRA